MANSTLLEERFEAVRQVSTRLVFNYGMMIGTLSTLQGLLKAKNWEALRQLNVDYFTQSKFVGVGHALGRLLDDSLPMRDDATSPRSGNRF